MLSLGSGFLAQERFGVNLMKMAFSTADEPPSQGPLTRKRSITEVDDGDSVFFRLPQVRIIFVVANVRMRPLSAVTDDLHRGWVVDCMVNSSLW